MAQQETDISHATSIEENGPPQDDSRSSSSQNTVLPTARTNAGRRNIMLDKFEAVDDAELDRFARKADLALAEAYAQEREGKELYFFYGSLMFPRMLQHVLDLPELPVLTPAEIFGLHMKVWGPYPALVEGKSGEVVQGMAYEVEGGEAKDKLARYETECYRTRKFMIDVSGQEESVLATTFVWAGAADELDEGTFDRDSWEKRMVRILDR